MKLSQIGTFFTVLFILSCGSKQTTGSLDITAEKSAVNKTMDQWHKAAANADFTDYFNRMTKDAIFIGTDATENWSNTEFRAFSKPYFDRGKAWYFTPLERHIYFSDKSDLAWFDELLDTQMGVCRGSGVLKKQDGQWKIVHYVLSMTIPNNQVKSVVSQKRISDSLLIKKIKVSEN